MDVVVTPDGGVREHPLNEYALIAQELHRQRDVEDTVRAVVREAQRAQLGDAFSVLLVEGRTIRSAAVSDAHVAEADALQLELTEGPGVDAALTRGTVLSADLREESRWGFWTPQAVRLGWRSVLSVGFSDSETVGALTSYRRARTSPEDQDVALTRVFAVHAAVAVAHARERESLSKAVEARNLIGQAQGILMERYQLDAEQAFSVLRRYSSHSNRKLRHVAADLVHNRELPDDVSGNLRPDG